MAEPVKRIPRPTPTLETNEGSQPSISRGVNKGHLTLYLSIGAILLSVASASIQLIIFYSGEQRALAAKAALDSAEQQLVAEKIKTEKINQQKGLAETAKADAERREAIQNREKLKGETVSAERKGALDQGVITDGLINSFRESLWISGTGGIDSRLLFSPPPSFKRPNPYDVNSSKTPTSPYGPKLGNIQ